LLLPRLRRRIKPPSRAPPPAPLRRFAGCVAFLAKLTLPRASSCCHEAVMPHAVAGGAPERRRCMKPEPVTMADRRWPVSARSPFASSAIVAACSGTLSSPPNPAACAGNTPCWRSQPSHPNFHKFLSYAFVRISYVHLRMHFYSHLFYLILATYSCCPYLVVPC
jgi:hypothetical protein